jgi:hypothetical protein
MYACHLLETLFGYAQSVGQAKYLLMLAYLMIFDPAKVPELLF